MTTSAKLSVADANTASSVVMEMVSTWYHRVMYATTVASVQIVKTMIMTMILMSTMITTIIARNHRNRRNHRIQAVNENWPSLDVEHIVSLFICLHLIEYGKK